MRLLSLLAVAWGTQDGITGTWVTERGTFILSQEGEAIRGTYLPLGGSRAPVRGSARGNEVTLVYGLEGTGSFLLADEGRSLCGRLQGPGFPAGEDCTGRRAGSAPADDLKAVAAVAGDAGRDLAERLRALREIAAMGPAARPAVPDLVKLLRDPTIEVRDLASNALGILGPEAVPALLASMRDGPEWPANMAASALGRCDRTAVPLLSKALGEENREVRLLVLRALIWMGEEAAEAAPAVAALLKDEDPATRRFAVRALAGTGTPAISAVVGALGDSHPRVRTWAAEAAGSLGAEAVPNLVALLDNAEVRPYALHALRRIGPAARDAVPALTRLLKDPNLGREVERALARIQPPPPKVPEPVEGHWPGWRGPNRDNVSTETGLLRKWPEGGPPLLWETQGIGQGISSIAVAGGRVFVLGYTGDSEFVTALDERTGRSLWSARIGPGVHENGLMRWLAQRAPTVDGERVWAFQMNGSLVCLDAAAGRELWRKDYVRDFGARPYSWGYCDYPLVDGNALILRPGGTRGALMALDKKTGGTIWSAPGPYTGAHAATVVAEAGGVRQYVATFQGRLVSFAARGGRELWRHDEALVSLSRERAEKEGLAARVQVEHKDLFTADLSSATVVALYLPPDFLDRLRPQLETLKPGARIVSHQFKFPGVEPDRTVTLDSKETGDVHAVHLWTAPLRKPTK